MNSLQEFPKRKYQNLSKEELGHGFASSIADAFEYAKEMAVQCKGNPNGKAEFTDWYNHYKNEAFELTESSRKELEALLIEAMPDISRRELAEAIGIPKSTVIRDLADPNGSKPETPTEKPNLELQQKNEPSAKKIIVDIYPQKGGKRGYQIKITDGTCFIKQSKDLELCETIKKAINEMKYIQDIDGINKAKALANDIIKQQTNNEPKPSLKKGSKPQSTPKNDEPVDFSFLAEEPQELEEDTELNDALNKMASEAELMAEFKDAICIPAVAEFLIKSLKEKLSQYPDTLENANNEDRKAFVNVFNILKKIIRKEG